MRTLPVFLLLFTLCLRGQESDTLLLRILGVKSDTERVNQLYTRGFGLRNRDPQLAFDYAKRCEREAIAARSQKHLAKSYNLLGVLYYRKGDFKTAVSYHRQALDLRMACNDVLGIAYSQTNLGNVYSDLKLYERAENAYLQAMSAYRQLGNTEKAVGSLVNIGIIKHRLKQYDQAIENYQAAMKMVAANDYDTRAMCLTNLGEAYVGKGLTEQAIACNQDALKLRELSDNEVEAADNYLNLGGIYTITGEFEKAQQLIDTACIIAGRFEYFDLLYEARKVRAIYYSAIKDYESAFSWMKRYNDLGDSIIMQQSNERLFYDFNNLAPTQSQEAKAPLNNGWLLVILSLFAIIIPLYLIRFKR